MADSTLTVREGVCKNNLSTPATASSRRPVNRPTSLPGPGWAGEKLVLTVSEGRFRDACFVARERTAARATDPFPTLAKGGPGGGWGGDRESSGSTVGATPRARYPWTEQMARKMLRNVVKRGVQAAFKVAKRCALDGRCHPTFRHFHAAIQGALGAISTKHFRQPASLTTPILQQLDDANSLPRKG